MNCKECEELLASCLEGDLDQTESGQVRDHLETCPECRSQLALEQKMNSGLERLPKHVPDAETILRVSEEIYAIAPKPRRTAFGPVMDVDELAEYLRVGQDTLDIYLEEIPCFELGGKILFRQKSVEQWIEEREKSFELEMKAIEIKKLTHPVAQLSGGAKWTA